MSYTPTLQGRNVRSITLINAKGGSGKSTLACNLASFLANWGIRVTLVDFDRQGSALDWLTARPADRPTIRALRADSGQAISADSDYRILDVPAGIHGAALAHLLRLSDTVIIPVLPSPMDIRAAGRFISELLQNEDYRPELRLCVVANRVRAGTQSYRALEKFLARLGIPFIARLRDTQNYLRATERGLGIFELPRREVIADLVQWQPLIAWVCGDPRLTLVPTIGDATDTS